MSPSFHKPDQALTRSQGQVDQEDMPGLMVLSGIFEPHDKFERAKEKPRSANLRTLVGGYHASGPIL